MTYDRIVGPSRCSHQVLSRVRDSELYQCSGCANIVPVDVGVLNGEPMKYILARVGRVALANLFRIAFVAACALLIYALERTSIEPRAWLLILGSVHTIGTAAFVIVWIRCNVLPRIERRDTQEPKR